MTEPTSPDESIVIGLDDQVLFRLRDGRLPVAYPDTVTRVSYEIGVSVIHTGAVWALGYVDEAEALELDDGTVVLAEDIEPESLVVTPPSLVTTLTMRRT